MDGPRGMQSLHSAHVGWQKEFTWLAEWSLVEFWPSAAIPMAWTGIRGQDKKVNCPSLGFLRRTVPTSKVCLTWLIGVNFTQVLDHKTWGIYFRAVSVLETIERLQSTCVDNYLYKTRPIWDCVS